MRSPGLNCIDIVRPYAERVTRADMPPVQLMGGVGSVALQHERSVILPSERRTVAPADLALSQFRDNGTKRDIETMVLSTIIEDAQRVEKCAKDSIGESLEIETFGFRDIARKAQLVENPFSWTARMKTFLSDRYMEADRLWTPDGPDVERFLFPFSVPMPSDSLETWTVEVDGVMEFPVPAPGASILNYLTRVVSGLRGKDAEKVQTMARAIFAKAPETLEWIMDGPGQPQLEMARILQGLRHPDWRQRPLVVGDKLVVDPVLPRTLQDHEAFLLKDAAPQVQDDILTWARFRSEVLYLGYQNPWIVDGFQNHIVPRMPGVIHNE